MLDLSRLTLSQLNFSLKASFTRVKRLGCNHQTHSKQVNGHHYGIHLPVYFMTES